MTKINYKVTPFYIELHNSRFQATTLIDELVLTEFSIQTYKYEAYFSK